MVIAAGRDKQRARAVALHQLEPENVDVERCASASRATWRCTWPITVLGVRPPPGAALLGRPPSRIVEVDRIGAHLECAVDERPLGARAVAIDLDAVAVPSAGYSASLTP